MTVSTDITPDILGEPFEARTLPLRRQDGVRAVATLVRRPATRPERGAVLYVHGFADYFFQVHVAEHFASRGYDFYALDLRGYGRSLLPHQLPNYCTDLSCYYEELDAAAAAIRADGHDRLVVLGHSTGGLVTALWAHDRRDEAVLDALVLNSPWLELAEPWPIRAAATALVSVLGRVAPSLPLQAGRPEVYGRSIHGDHHGEWDYRLDWKPLATFPVRAGWLRAIRRGHARVHRGLDIAAPVLVLHSTRSELSGRWGEEATRADTVLDVDQIARWAPSLGADVSVVPVEDGLHDLFLSPPPVRERALEATDAWLAALPDPSSAPTGIRSLARPEGWGALARRAFEALP